MLFSYFMLYGRPTVEMGSLTLSSLDNYRVMIFEKPDHLWLFTWDSPYCTYVQEKEGSQWKVHVCTQEEGAGIEN